MMQHEGATYEADGMKTIHGVVEKGPESQIVVFESSFKGKDYFNFREFYQDRSTGNWKPTAKGFTLIEDVQVEDLLNACRVMIGEGI